MTVFKYLMPDGWRTLYAGVLNRILLKDKNLSDLTDRARARENLELTGINNSTHYHDSHYVPMIQRVAADSDAADADIRSQLDNYVKKVGNEELQVYAPGTVVNPVSITYDGTKATIDKLFYMQQGIYPEKIAETTLNTYTKIGFFWGTTGSTLHTLPAVIGTNCTFGGVCVGGVAAENGKSMAQIVWSQNACVCRTKMDSNNVWGAWQQMLTSETPLDATKLTGVLPLNTVPDMIGASEYSAGVKGIPVAPAAGEQKYFLRGDNTWAEVEPGTHLIIYND